VSRVLLPLTMQGRRPPYLLGVLVAAAGTALETLAIYALGHLAPAVSLGVVYVFAVIGVAVYWGTLLGLATALASALAFNYTHLPPVGRLTLADARTWVAFATLALVAIMAGLVGGLARQRSLDAEQRRDEADLGTEIARLLLGDARLEVARAATAQRIATAIGASSAALELGEPVAGDQRRVAFQLRDGDQSIGTLLLPAALGAAERNRVATRIVPTLQAVLAASLHRAELQRDVVETALLRRSDEMKTAVLRSVSHDLRTPLSAILTAASALDPQSLPSEAVEARAVVLEAATRLSRLVEKLLDLSLLQSGSVAQRSEQYSLEDVLHEAAAHVEGEDGASALRIALDEDLPQLVGDPAQLERAFANVLENAVRYSNGKPVSVRAHVAGERVRVRVVDQGPGIRPSELDRIFMPFYRSPDAGAGHQGSGLGLAIARGFVELAGGRIEAESLPRQGTTFVVELPLAQAPARGDLPRSRRHAHA
jgi:two-component system, OmpR family, sensor histidine kinase KdpD